MTETWFYDVDKDDWPKGEWTKEPDRVEWTDPDTGFACRIWRDMRGCLHGGFSVPKGHALHGLLSPEWAVGIQGGWLHARPFLDNCWWFGFDCAHSGDWHPQRSEDAQYTEYATYKTIGYCRAEINRLIRAATGRPDNRPEPTLL